MEQWKAVDAHNRGVEAQNGDWRGNAHTLMRSRILIRISVKSRIRIRFHVKGWILIRMKGMLIRNPERIIILQLPVLRYADGRLQTVHCYKFCTRPRPRTVQYLHTSFRMCANRVHQTTVVKGKSSHLPLF
jgi:hypothetical protein